MSADGAHLGVSASRVLGTILGGEPSPTDDERMRPDEFRAVLLAAPGPPFDGDDSYGLCANYAARLILEAFLADPHLASVPTENVIDEDAWRADNYTHYEDHIIKRGLYGVLKTDRPETHAALDDLGLSGFMWGWAVNAARFCVELPPVPNPALLTMRVREDT